MASKELRRRLIQELTEYLQDTASREDLQLLLTKDEHWNALVEEAKLSRHEACILRKAVKELMELVVREDKDRLQKEFQDKKKSREAFSSLKRELEEIIRKLRALADRIDEIHKNCTVSNVVTNSTSTASGVLGILGVVLAPVTAGGSLMLSASGLGLGVVATVTGAVTVVVEETSRWSVEAEARRLVSLAVDKMKELIAISKISFKIIYGPYSIIKNLKTFREHIRAFRMARANPHLVENARILMSTGEVTAECATQVQNAFKGTALAMTKKARIRGIAISGAFLALDMYSLAKDSVHLYDGAKSESGKALRELARKLEEKLREFDQFHRSL